MPTFTTVLTGEIAPELEKTYLHLPFDMPAQAARLSVIYQYSDQISSDPTLTGGNTIDLGVFDERGIDFLTAGFRGWTGSERMSIEITPTQATPGYLPGPLNPGRWHVLLGLYKIAETGCQYQVTINITTAEPVEQIDASLPPSHAAPWLRGELHCHTHHSDGALSPAELVARARQRGLDFIAVTDHNSTAAQGDLAKLTEPGLTIIRGIEVTTFKGHFNAWGSADWFDFRVQSSADMQSALKYAVQHGALTACGHPKPFGPDWDYPEVSNYDCVEVWNGPWTGLNELSLTYWLNLLASGQRKPAVGGSDFHRTGTQSGGVERDLGTPTNWVYVPGAVNAGDYPANGNDISPDTILTAIRHGHVTLSAEPDGPFLDLRAGPNFTLLPGDSLSMLGDDLSRLVRNILLVRVTCLRARGCRLILLDADGARHEQPVTTDEITLELNVTLNPTSSYLRAELRDADDRVRALTNPIYLLG